MMRRHRRHSDAAPWRVFEPISMMSC
jgi:hypothetical protein